MKLANVLAALALALLALVLFLVTRDSGTGKPPVPTAWPLFDRTAVTTYTITVKGGESVTLRRRPGASDQWDVQQGVYFVPGDSNRIDDLLLAFSRQKVQERLERGTLSDAEFAQFDLDEPNSTLTIEMPGQEIALRYGRRAPGGKLVYVDAGEGTDVYVVESDAQNELLNAFQNSLVSNRLFASLGSSFDVKSLTVETGGGTALKVELDPEGNWRVRAPYEGYAEPLEFNRVLAALILTPVTPEEYGAPDLARYGLLTPRAKVHFVARNGSESAALLGDPLDPAQPQGASYALIDGTQHVMRVPDKWVAAALGDPARVRDHSFTRLGIDGVRVKLKDGESFYELRREGPAWDITEPAPRQIADGAAVESLLDELRSWHTRSFEDGMTPVDAGIDGSVVLEIERQSGKLVQFEFGRKVGEDAVYAVRKGDGQVEVVLLAPLERLRRGYQQFRTKRLGALYVDDFDAVGRWSPESVEGVEAFRVARDLDSDKEAHWLDKSPGTTAVFQPERLWDILAAVRDLQVERWIPYDPADTAAALAQFGLGESDGAYFTLEFGYDEHRQSAGAPTLQVGSVVTEGVGKGGRFARLKTGPTHPNHRFVFVLSDDVVQRLAQPVHRAP